MLGYVASYTVSNTATKLIYNRHPQMPEMEFIFWRCSIQIFFFMVLMNVRVKHILWDSVPPNKGAAIMGRIVQRIILMFTLLYSIKELPVGIVSLVTQTSPLFVALLGYILLREKITMTELACLVMAFTGVTTFLVNPKASSARYEAVNADTEE